MLPRRSILFLAATLVTTPSRAQEAAVHIARGDSAYAAFNAEEALAHYESAIAVDSTNADALGKASRSAVDLGESLTNGQRQKDLFRKGERYARLAVRADSTNAEAWFHLARALGRTALSVGVRDRVRYAVDVRRYAMNALAISSGLSVSRRKSRPARNGQYRQSRSQAEVSMVLSRCMRLPFGKTAWLTFKAPCCRGLSRSQVGSSAVS